MGIAEEIHEHIKKMPLEMANEVLDFIKCLEVRHLNANVKSEEVMQHLQISIEQNYRLGELLAK